jgi:shikimate dehydrogenase
LLTLTGVVGHPVAHSRSPAMMNAAFEALGLKGWRYEKIPVPPRLFAETIRSLPESGYRGVNVTIPHKEAALDIADEASDAARAIGAANTLTFEDDAIKADNTDAGGLLAALPLDPNGLSALVLGAGGAGRAAAWALKEGGATVSVWNRTPERAERLAVDLGVTATDAPTEVDIVVNATSVGLEPGAMLEDLPLGWIEPPQVAVELVYGNHEKPFQAWAEASGCQLVDGLEILVRQGALSLSRWTAQEAPLEVMRGAARDAART